MNALNYALNFQIFQGQKEEKTFSVGEYGEYAILFLAAFALCRHLNTVSLSFCFFLVLPKFEVDVLTNSYAAFGNGDIRGVVSAK